MKDGATSPLSQLRQRPSQDVRSSGRKSTRACVSIMKRTAMPRSQSKALIRGGGGAMAISQRRQKPDSRSCSLGPDLLERYIRGFLQAGGGGLDQSQGLHRLHG